MSGDATRNRGAFCPSCERFIGPSDTCPYCEADSAKSPMLRALRWASLVLALAGLLFLYLATVATELPVVKISDITPMMNFARVQIAGTVQNNPYVGEKKGTVDYLSFDINDGSGDLRVVAHGAVARALKSRGATPAQGDWAEVIGNLDVSADNKPRLRIISAENVRIGSRKADGKGLREKE